MFGFIDLRHVVSPLASNSKTCLGLFLYPGDVLVRQLWQPKKILEADQTLALAMSFGKVSHLMDAHGSFGAQCRSRVR